MECHADNLRKAREKLEENGKNKEWSGTVIKSLVKIDKAVPRLAKLEHCLNIAKKCPTPLADCIGRDFPDLKPRLQISNGLPLIAQKCDAFGSPQFGNENLRDVERDRVSLARGIARMMQADSGNIAQAGNRIKATRVVMADFGVKGRDWTKFYEECLLYAVVINTERAPFEKAPPYFFTVRPDQKEKLGYGRGLNILLQSDEDVYEWDV